MCKEWLRSGKSKTAYVVDKIGYFGGGAHRSTTTWSQRLLDAMRAPGATGDMDLVRTFVAHFNHLYGGKLRVDSLFMGVADLAAAERSLDPTAPPPPKQTANAKRHAKRKQTVAKQPQTAKPVAEAQGWADAGPDLATAIGTPVAPPAVPETNPGLNVEQPPTESLEMANQPPTPTTGVGPSQRPNQALAVWDQVQDWRANQAVVDWRTAERVRNHVTMLTAQHVAEVPALNPDGTPKLDSLGRPKTKLVSTLTPMQVRQLAEATAAVQRTQRLAIGLATDNIGIDIPRGAGESNVAQPAQADEAPLFIVEMNQNGKFVRQRPTRVR